MNDYLEDSVIVPLKRTLFTESLNGEKTQMFGQIGWYGYLFKTEVDVNKENPERSRTQIDKYIIRVIPINLESRFWNDPLSHFVLTVSPSTDPKFVLMRTWGSRWQIQNALNAEFGENYHLVTESVQ
jgi:hypothetical protein